MQALFPALTLFGPSHLAVLGTIVGTAFVLVMWARLAGSDTTRRNIAFALALAMVAVKLISLRTIFVIEHLTWTHALPMHMCDWAAIAAIVALLWRNQTAYEMAYFWGLAGTLQATLTPDLKYEFPDIRFLTFFLSHGGTLVAIAFLTLGLKLRPYPKSLLRIMLWSQVYLVCAGAVDWLINENYGYLRAKPIHASLLDHLGPWPWYILSLEGMALLSFLIYYSPFFIADLIKKRHIATAD